MKRRTTKKSPKSNELDKTSCCNSQSSSCTVNTSVNETLSEIYTAEKIIGKRIQDGRVEYYVKWLGYPNEENTWEPLEHLRDALILIDKFECETAVENCTRNDEQDKTWIPEEICGAHNFDGVLKFIVKGRRNNELVERIVSAKRFRFAHPQLVIDFYQKSTKWV